MSRYVEADVENPQYGTVCTECGTLVRDRKKHDEFHDKIKWVSEMVVIEGDTYSGFHGSISKNGKGVLYFTYSEKPYVFVMDGKNGIGIEIMEKDNGRRISNGISIPLDRIDEFKGMLDKMVAKAREDNEVD